MRDAKGKEIHEGDHVVYATWGMFDVDESVWRKYEGRKYIARRDTDPKYVTHLAKGVVETLLREEDGSLHIRPDGVGVNHLITHPLHDARPEYVEVVDT